MSGHPCHAPRQRGLILALEHRAQGLCPVQMETWQLNPVEHWAVGGDKVKC